MSGGLLVLVFVAAAFVGLAIFASRSKKESKHDAYEFSTERKKGALKNKFSDGFDPFTGNPLTNPVDLKINHPEKGSMTLKVNKSTAINYLKYGPRAFHKMPRNQNGDNRKYYINDAGYGDDGFDLIDGIIFYELFMASNGGYFFDPGMVDSTVEGGGGEFGGGGASGDFSTSDNSTLADAGQNEPAVQVDDSPNDSSDDSSSDYGDSDGDSGGDSGGDGGGD